MEFPVRRLLVTAIVTAFTTTIDTATAEPDRPAERIES